MKYIQKGLEPESFSQWKAQKNENWSPTFEGLQNQEKKKLYDSLLAEQGYLCCYCNTRIASTTDRDREEEADDCHIEHFKPQSCYPEAALDYANLLVSCQAEQAKNPPPALRCGHKKDNWYDDNLLVSPLQPDCETCFRYTADGQILSNLKSSRHEAAKTTIDRLGLNTDKLRATRSLAISGLGIETLTEEEIQQFIEGLGKRDAPEKYTPFCPALIYILKQLIPD